MTLDLVLISWSCSLTHMMLVTMEAQQTNHDTELNDRWDVESRSKWGGAEETVVRLQLLEGKFSTGLSGRQEEKDRKREMTGHESQMCL